MLANETENQFNIATPSILKFKRKVGGGARYAGYV